jgi:hypothetical protein
MENWKRKAAYLLVTSFFLLIAWATSIEEPWELRSLPLSAQAEEGHIWLKNEALAPLSELTLVLNGIYTLDGFELAAGAEERIPFTDFKDRNGVAILPGERPQVLEVYQNGSGQLGTGGYSKFMFD